MQLEKPKIQRTCVTAIDQDTGKSKSMTVYSTTPEQVIETLRRVVSGDEADKPRRRERQTA